MDLFDIMHLGIEARQFHQVMRLREEVARLAYYTEIAAQKMELLNYYRQIIYWARQKNNELAGEIRNAPIQVFVLSSVIFNQINGIISIIRGESQPGAHDQPRLSCLAAFSTRWAKGTIW